MYAEHLTATPHQPCACGRTVGEGPEGNQEKPGGLHIYIKIV